MVLERNSAALFKLAHYPRFDAVERKDGEWYVRLTLPGSRQLQIDGFKKAEAGRWIKAQSAAGLKMYESGKYA
jgi:hypothetical protein